jgi:ABC-type sugar transport system substrate-binding protein
VTPDEIRRAADGLAETLAAVEAGTLDATPQQRAYMAGALHALRAVLGDVDLLAP